MKGEPCFDPETGLLRNEDSQYFVTPGSESIAADLDLSVGLLNDLQTHPQAQARAGHSLGGKKWFEDAPGNVTRHSMTAVRHSDAHSLTPGRPVRRRA